jgi:putative PIN family toxin of toxin-antitoxin system
VASRADLPSTATLVVLDANVFVSAAIQRGASYRIVQSWLAGGASFEVVMCPALLDEIREVLTDRPRLRKWISLETATLFTDTIGTLVDLVDNPEQIDTETRDPDDDYLIALARAKDLLEWEPQRPPVITPSEFEQRFGTG